MHEAAMFSDIFRDARDKRDDVMFDGRFYFKNSFCVKGPFGVDGFGCFSWNHF